MQQIMKQAQQNLIKSRIPPIFADEVVIITPVRTTKEKNGKCARKAM